MTQRSTERRGGDPTESEENSQERKNKNKTMQQLQEEAMKAVLWRRRLIQLGLEKAPIGWDPGFDVYDDEIDGI